MNPAPLPSLPRLWTHYLMWQRSWTEAIPGVPDSTTDYSEWNGYGTIQEYFDADAPGDDNDMSADVIARLIRIEEKIDLILNGAGTPPGSTQVAIITAEPRANARFKSGQNANGKPIMQIYPKDTAPANERVQFLSGEFVKVKPGLVTADGGAKYYELLDRKGKAGETLYVKESEADLV